MPLHVKQKIPLLGSQSPNICLNDEDNIFAQMWLFEIHNLQDRVLVDSILQR